MIHIIVSLFLKEGVVSSIQIPSLHLYLVYFILLVVIQLCVKKRGIFALFMPQKWLVYTSI